MIKYNYLNLREVNAKKEVNFYGVIVDATFPCKEENDDLFTCTVKVIDYTINQLTNSYDLQNNQIYVTIKSDSIEHLPFVHHIGDLLRIHRGVYVHKLKRNVYINLETKGPMKSSWCIFAAASDPLNRTLEPIACSSRTFTFEEGDSNIINNLRSWVRTYLKEKGSLAYSKTIKLADRNKDLSTEKDLIVHVVSKSKVSSDTISLYVQDDSDACELVVYSLFNFVEPGNVIRVRSFRTYQK